MVGEDDSDRLLPPDLRRGLRAHGARAERLSAGTRPARSASSSPTGRSWTATSRPGTIGGDSTARLIATARMDDKIKAVVLRVDSPGGSVTASEQIYRELQALQGRGQAGRGVDGQLCRLRRLLHLGTGG